MKNLKTEDEIIAKWECKYDKPVLSIFCTTYNHEPYISKAINGFLMQKTDFPFEVLIRDDCSTDKTAKIVKQYADKYPNIIKPVFEKKNTYSKGVRPMLQLYKIAKRKYIALCEGDDFWIDEYKLQKQFDFLELRSEYVIVSNNSFYIDQKEDFKFYNLHSLRGKSFDFTQRDLMLYNPCITLTVMFRNISEIINNLPDVYSQGLGGDRRLFLLLLSYGKGRFVNDVVGVYRKHSGGITNIYKNSYSKLINGRIESIKNAIKWNDYFNERYTYEMYSTMNRQSIKIIKYSIRIMSLKKLLIGLKYFVQSKKMI